MYLIDNKYVIAFLWVNLNWKFTHGITHVRNDVKWYKLIGTKKKKPTDIAISGQLLQKKS